MREARVIQAKMQSRPSSCLCSWWHNVVSKGGQGWGEAYIPHVKWAENVWGFFFKYLFLWLCQVLVVIWDLGSGSQTRDWTQLCIASAVLATGPPGSPVWGLILPECVRKGLTEVVILEEHGRIAGVWMAGWEKQELVGWWRCFRGGNGRSKGKEGKNKKGKEE